MFAITLKHYARPHLHNSFNNLKLCFSFQLFHCWNSHLETVGLPCGKANVLHLCWKSANISPLLLFNLNNNEINYVLHRFELEKPVTRGQQTSEKRHEFKCWFLIQGNKKNIECPRDCKELVLSEASLWFFKSWLLHRLEDLALEVQSCIVFGKLSLQFSDQWAMSILSYSFK